MTDKQSPVLYFDHLLAPDGQPTRPPIYRVRTCMRTLGTVERYHRITDEKQYRAGRKGRVHWNAVLPDGHVQRGHKTRRAAAEWLLAQQKKED